MQNSEKRSVDQLPELTVACSWCGKILQQGREGAKVSHGVCGECKNIILTTAGLPPKKEIPQKKAS